MTGTITLTTDLINERIGVQLSSWAAADGPVTVKRVHPDTSEYAVRGSGAGGTMVTSGGSTFAWDYEAPFNVPVTYYAFDGATKVTSSSATLAVSYPLLRAPGLPANDATFDLMSEPDVQFQRPTALLYPLGRSTPIPLSTSRASKGSFTISVRTKTDASATALLTTVTQSSVCLLLMPGIAEAWQYVAVMDVKKSPMTHYRAPSGAPSNHIAKWQMWTLSCAVVGQPTGGVFGDPTASYLLLKNSFATYTAVKAYYATYLNVLKGYP